MPGNVKRDSDAAGSVERAPRDGDASATTRRYRSERRAQQARETRAAIVDAALRLFVERGYASTSIATIAETAGVAPETVYAIFKNKRALLAAIEDEAIVGDTDPVPLFDRPFVEAARELPSARARVRALRPGLEATARSATIADVVRRAAAADEGVAAMWKDRQAARYADSERFVALVAEAGPLLLDFREAVDLSWALSGPEVCHMLLGERGWSVERYVTVISEMLESFVADAERDGGADAPA